MEKNDLEAVKLLSIWSQWVASIQTGIISLIGLISASGHISIVPKHTLLGYTSMFTLILSVICFLISLLAASFLLYTLPGIAQRLPPNPGEDIFMMGTFNGTGTKVVIFSELEFGGFFIGVIFLAFWAITQVIILFAPEINYAF